MSSFAQHFRHQVAVLGAGTMGAGIAQTFVAAGWRVSLVDPSEAQRTQAADHMARDLGYDPRDAGTLNLLSDIGLVDGAAFVIESVPEDARLKMQVLAEAEQKLAPELLCSNTSSLGIGELQAALKTPQNFLGMHFFQPVPQTRLVELVTSSTTSAQTLALARQCTEELGRKPIVVADSPGFATSRLGIAIGLEAMRMLEDGIATASDIDDGMILGYQHAVGPLRMTDMVGLDVRLAISEHLSQTLGPRFEPPQLLRDKVALGELGRKSGQGFFSWEPMAP